MSVLLEMSMFPTDKSESKSKEVSEVIKIIRESGVTYQLTAMATLIETDTLKANDAENIYDEIIWNDYEKKITQEEFDDFVNNVDRSQLPEGIKFELK